MRDNNTVYLAVWNLGEPGERRIEFDNLIESARISYPKNHSLHYSVDGSYLNVSFTEEYQARFFEIHFK